MRRDVPRVGVWGAACLSIRDNRKGEGIAPSCVFTNSHSVSMFAASRRRHHERAPATAVCRRMPRAEFCAVMCGGRKVQRNTARVMQRGRRRLR